MADAKVPGVTLAPGVEMPGLGYGVGTAWFKAQSPERSAELRGCVLAALDAGFRHVDDAEMYENDLVSGAAIREWLERTGTPRERLFITHKVMSVDAGIAETCKKSLENMGVGYFDLYLIHAPFCRGGEAFKTPLREAWSQMEALVDAGLVKTIGVSNWRVSDLEQLKGARIRPACNQIEAHPYLQQPALLEYCQAQGIVVTAYSPQLPVSCEQLQGAPAEPALAAAAAAHGVSAGQVLLRWAWQTGRVPITTTSKPERLAEYLAIFGFELTGEEVAAISAAGSERHFRKYWQELDGKA